MKKVKVTIWLLPDVDKGLEIAMAKTGATKSAIVENLIKTNFPVEIAQARGVIRRKEAS